MTNPYRQIVLVQKLVSAAKSLISHQIGMPLGCVRISKIITWLKPYQKIDMPVVEQYLEATLGLPIGSERLNWNSEALKQYDKKLRKINSKYEAKIFDACYEIIDVYDTKS